MSIRFPTEPITRRQWLTALAGGGAAAFWGCSGNRGRHRTSLRAAEKRRVEQAREVLPIVQWKVGAGDPTSVLKSKALPAMGLPAGFLGKLERLMRETLRRSGGVGLAAPQVGISRRMVLVELQNEKKEVICCLDPRIVRHSDRIVPGYEACLSVRGVGGRVRRHEWVELAYLDPAGVSRTRRSEGWEARIFQHEIDHLDGTLYLDRLEGRLLPIDEVRRLRRLEKEKRSKRPGADRGVGPVSWLRRPGVRWFLKL